MKWLKTLGSFLKGDFVKNAMDFVNTRWPPDMSEAQKAQMEVVIKDMLHKQQMEVMEAAREDEAMFNERTIALEGTAKDLTAIPVVGALVIFLRGAFRPLFAYGVLYWDWVYFTVGVEWTDQKERLLVIVNILVLVFFFGERAMKNIMPLITQMFAAREVKPT